MRVGLSLSLLVLSAAAPLLSLTLVEGCTDNGDTAHGPNIGTIPKVDAGGPGDGDGGGGTNPDGGGDLDGSPDANPFEEDGSTPPCTNGVVAVLAGSDTTLSAAIKDKSADWASQVIMGGAAKSKPAVVPFGAGFLGVTHGAGDVLQALSSSAGSTTWSAATTIGGSGVKGSPALGVVGTKAHVVYSAGPNTNTDFTHGIHDGANWNAATAAVGAPPSFGTVSAGIVGAGAAGATDLVFAENGTNNGLYVRTFDTAWSTSTPIVGAGTVGATPPATPELVSIEGTGQLDLLLIFVEKDTRRLSYATRETTSKAWSTDKAAGRGGNIHTDANTAEKLSVSRSGQSNVLVTFRGQDGKGYFTQGTIAAQSITWTAASAVAGGAAIAVDSSPAVAKGVCGDDAIVAYASAGVVYATRLRGTTWKIPDVISGLGGSRVAIATK